MDCQLARCFALLAVCVLLCTGCDGPFPAQSKEGVPDDHTVNQGGALHKSGLEHPFRENSGCSDFDCHHDDLRGGLAIVEGVKTVAPSCYQCHDNKWDDDDRATPTISTRLLSTHIK